MTPPCWNQRFRAWITLLKHTCTQVSGLQTGDLLRRALALSSPPCTLRAQTPHRLHPHVIDFHSHFTSQILLSAHFNSTVYLQDAGGHERAGRPWARCQGWISAQFRRGTRGHSFKCIIFFLTYLNLCAWWCTGPPNRLAGEWHSCDNRATFLFWLGLAANFTVMGSEEPGGLWPLKFVIASSASDLLSKRINATPLDKPFNQTNKKKQTKNGVQDKLKIT